MPFSRGGKRSLHLRPLLFSPRMRKEYLFVPCKLDSSKKKEGGKSLNQNKAKENGGRKFDSL